MSFSFEMSKRNRSKRAGLQFPVGRLKKYLHEKNLAAREGITAAVYLASVLEYLMTEILELAGNETKNHKKKRITPRHIFLGIKKNTEIELLLKQIIIPQEGIPPILQRSKKLVLASVSEPELECDEKTEETFFNYQKIPPPLEDWPDLIKNTKELYGIVSFTILESPKQTIIVVGEIHDKSSQSECEKKMKEHQTYGPEYILKLMEIKPYFFDFFLERGVLHEKTILKREYTAENINYLDSKLDKCFEKFFQKKCPFSNIRAHVADVRPHPKLEPVLSYWKLLLPFWMKTTHSSSPHWIYPKIGI